jgi:hypothetical protein
MTRNVNIKFEKPTSFVKWEDLSSAYLFVTDGSKFLQGVLSYTYTVTVQDNIRRNKDGIPYSAGAKGTYTYQYYKFGTFGPYYDYGCVTNSYNTNEGKSTLSLAKFDKSKYTPIENNKVGPKTDLFKFINEDTTDTRNNVPALTSTNNQSNTSNLKSDGVWSNVSSDSSLNGIVDLVGNIGKDNNLEYVNGKKYSDNLSEILWDKYIDITKQMSSDSLKHKTYLEMYGTIYGTVTVSYTYMSVIPNVNTDDNLYIFIGKENESATTYDDLGLYVSYQYNKKTNKFTQTGSLLLKPYEVPDTWTNDSGSFTGSFRIRPINDVIDDEPTTSENPFETFKEWINDRYADFVRKSDIVDTTTWSLRGNTVDNPKLISQRSRIYQVPTNELSSTDNTDLTLNLYYDSSYLCEVSPNVKSPDKETENDMYNKAITYSYLVSKNGGNVTLDGFPKHSYNYGYTFVPTIEQHIGVQNSSITYVSYTGSLKTVGEMFPGETYGSEDECKEAYKEWVKQVSFKKQVYINKTTYETSYDICAYGLNADESNLLNCYAYTSYLFSYTLRGIDSTSFVAPFDYLRNTKDVDPTTIYVPTFKIDYAAGNKRKWNLQWWQNNAEVTPVPEIIVNEYYVYDISIDKPGEYLKFQFSDDEFKTTKSMKASNRNNKITVTSHSDIFYLNIAQTSVSFNSFIPKITTSSDLSFHQTSVGGLNYGWRFAFVHKKNTTQSSEIYIGVPKFNNDIETSNVSDSFDDSITNLYDVCLKINYDVNEEIETETNNNIKTLSELKQIIDTVDVATVDVPVVTTDTKYFWTDDVFNTSGHEYKNVFAIETTSGIEYFGIRSKKHDQNERNDFRFDDTKPALSKTSTGTYYLGYDLCGRIVPLKVGKNNDYIYSFKNGEQYLKVNDEWKGKELFTAKISTYEFTVDREEQGPKYYLAYTENQDQRVNINCTYLKELYDTSGTLLPTYSTYSISIPFVKNTTVNENLVIKNSSYYGKTNSATFEGQFVEVPEANKGEILNNEYINIYYQDITYTKVKANNVDYIKKLETDPGCFYKYNSYLHTYELCSLDVIKKLKSLDDIYERYVIYSEITNSKNNDKTSNKNKTPYMQRYNYTEVDKNTQPYDSLCYASNRGNSSLSHTYIPQGTGIVTDNSIQYYAYTYALISDDEIAKYKKSGTSVYIKENHRVVTSDADFNSLISKHAKIYICHKPKTNPNGDYELYPIGASQITDDIDLEGNVIYVKEEQVTSEKTKKYAVDIDDLKKLVTKQNGIASTGITNIDEIKTRKTLTRRNILTGKTTFAADNVVNYICVFDYTNRYTEYTDIYENSWRYKFVDGELHVIDGSVEIDNENVSSFYIYVAETGYRKVDSTLISKGSKQQYYAWRIDKIQPNEIRTLNVTNPVDYIYVDASKFKLTHTFRTLDYSGVYTDPVTLKLITIAKVNNFGFIVNDNIRYYTRTLVTVRTEDVFMHPNKVYYRDGSIKTVKTTGSTPIINLTYTQYVENEDKLKFQYNSPYKVFNTGYTLELDKANYYNNTKVVSYLSDEYCEYAYNLPDVDNTEFIKTKFLYQTYTVNDNIKKSKGGAYYTNIYVFDKNNGAINKTLYLNQHIVDVNAYTYKLKEKHLELVDSDIALRNISPLNYKKYFISNGDGQITQLNELSESPAYYWNMPNCFLYTYVETENDYEYACQSVTGSYQYYNHNTNVPNVVVVDDNMFGIICDKYDISETPEGYSYNMFDLEVVKLYRMSKNNIGETIQEQTIKEKTLDRQVPFTLANDIEYKFNGSYSWHNPIFTYHTYNISGLSYEWKHVEETAGYWTKDYEKNVIPFQTASYIFYPDVNGISNTSSTYSFVPNSYVVSSVVEYPKIAYDTIDIVTEEQIYYSYVLGGVEQHYLSSNKIQVNPDGTYTGLVRQHVFDKDAGKFMYVVKPIQLSQHKIVTKNSKINNIVNQEHKRDTTYFAYKTSIALTNESVPVLYNTELMPATTKEIRYWNTETSSYQLKTVIASYAYYAYKYMYDTIPFKVSSYLFKASYLTIDNIGDLGAYIAKSLSPITDEINVTNSVLNTLGSYYTVTEQNKLLSINKAYDVISAYVKDGFVELGQTVTTLSNSLTDTLNNSLDKVSYQSEQNTNALVDTISAYSYTVSETINSLSTYVVQGIGEHKDKLVESLDTLSSYVKNIVLGDTIEIPESMELVTYNDVVISYSLTPNSNLDSLGELLLKSFVTATSETYSYIDANGYTHNIINYSYKGLCDTLSRIQVVPGIPTKQEFVMDLAPKMFANIDFDNEIVDDIKYDENGNITEKKTHKNNPTESAKKVIYRAGILWDELAKAGYCKDAAIEEKQNKLNEIKKNNLSTLGNLKNQLKN